MNKVVKTKERRSAIETGKAITNEEIAKMLKEAEKGPFYTSSEIKERIKNWKTKLA